MYLVGNYTLLNKSILCKKFNIFAAASLLSSRASFIFLVDGLVLCVSWIFACADWMEWIELSESEKLYTCIWEFHLSLSCRASFKWQQTFLIWICCAYLGDWIGSFQLMYFVFILFNDLYSIWYVSYFWSWVKSNCRTVHNPSWSTYYLI